MLCTTLYLQIIITKVEFYVEKKLAFTWVIDIIIIKKKKI